MCKTNHIVSHNDLIAQNCFLLISNPDSLDTILPQRKEQLLMCFSCCSWSFAHWMIPKANIVICDDMYSCTYHVSIGSDGFWILRVTIYSRIHKSYAPPYFFFPLLPADHPYSYT